MGHDISSQTRLILDSEWQLPDQQLDHILEEVIIADLRRSAGDPFASCIYTVLDAKDHMLVSNGYGEIKVSVDQLEVALIKVRSFQPSEKGVSKKFQQYLKDIGFEAETSEIIVGVDNVAPEISFLEKTIDYCKNSNISNIYICFS